ncbi:MAG: hypothetical protein Q8M66_05900 [Actinomycetota bacterium]|nr:hypothetical protein [Actinomycetota bacterium]
MSRLVAVVIAVFLVFTVAGCGGGDENDTGGEVSVQTGDGAAEAPAVEAVAGDAVDEADVLSPLLEQPFEPFPTDETLVPSAILDRLSTGQPMLLLFYDPAQRITDDQREAVDAVISDYRGIIDLVSYDIGKFVTTSESGKITLRPGITEDVDADKVARLLNSDNLNVTFTPYLIFVDTQGHITHRYRGYVDEKLIEREVLRATQ